ncbi:MULTISPECIES: serine hydrolase [Flavobacterium]|uniref:Serine hydrolase n=1 Tax=Flavobacterium jumunjinense TaxID=998845 RepID=A0ABV5GPY5_9FLAO|nr:MULTISPECIES: serine hydrolase [Flavobacterium]
MKHLKLTILLLNVICFTACNQRQSKTVNTNRLSSSINEYLTACESNGFNGAVLVTKRDSIIINKGYGFANKEKSFANTPKTVYDICSVTKQFTATAILKLAEDKKLKLTDSLIIYFKDLPIDKQNITIHHLLTHSAGFGHGIGKGDFDHIPEKEYFEQLFHTDLLFKPGEKYEYSNSGYSILGRIIEIVSGKSYESYIREFLFKPAGMYQTGYLLPEWDSDLVANEYLYNVINKENRIYEYQKDGKIAWPLKANGGIHSTQEDMYKWYLALKNNTVLNKQSIEKLTAPHILEYEGESSYYAYGWVTFQSDRSTKVITHNGFNGVSYYEFIWFPEEDALILFSTNSSTRESSKIPFELEKMLFNKNYKAKAISKSNVSELLKFSENYSGDLIFLGKELKQEFEEKLNNPAYLNRLSGVYLRANKINYAIVITELNTELFPLDGNVWDTMGDVYLAAKQNEKAINSYKKALELKPKDDDCFWCENSLEQLEKLKTKK